MKRFSQRYGYTPLEKAIVRECMPEEIVNSLCTAFDLIRMLSNGGSFQKKKLYRELEQTLWLRFLNRRLSDFGYDEYSFKEVAINVLNSIYPEADEWYLKLDMLEMAISYLRSTCKADTDRSLIENVFIDFINREFERHRYAYRIVENQIVEITSEEEIKSMESAISESGDVVRNHLHNAISAFAKRPYGDYVNSIKESISAVEALCREKTGEKTLGAAVKALEKKDMLSLPKVMKEGLDKIYAYTNQPSTGIRHALMETDGKYVPGSDEARYMLVVCSAFINYLNAKLK